MHASSPPATLHVRRRRQDSLCCRLDFFFYNKRQNCRLDFSLGCVCCSQKYKIQNCSTSQPTLTQITLKLHWTNFLRNMIGCACSIRFRFVNMGLVWLLWKDWEINLALLTLRYGLEFNFPLYYSVFSAIRQICYEIDERNRIKTWNSVISNC